MPRNNGEMSKTADPTIHPLGCGDLPRPAVDAWSNPPPPSSPVLNTLTTHIPPDIPPPAISPHPRPISPYFQASSELDPLVGFTAGTPPAHQRSNSHSASFELFTLLPPWLAHSSQLPTETGSSGWLPGLSAGLAMPSSRPPHHEMHYDGCFHLYLQLAQEGCACVSLCVSGLIRAGRLPGYHRAQRCGICGTSAHLLPIGCLLQVIITPKASASLRWLDRFTWDRLGSCERDKVRQRDGRTLHHHPLQNKKRDATVTP